MSNTLNEIFFETVLPTEALNIVAGEEYPLTIKEFFRGAFLFSELSHKQFKYPLMFGYRTNRQTTERDVEFNVTKQEETIILGMVNESNYDNAEKDAETLSITLNNYLKSDNGIRKILSDEGNISNYLIMNDTTMTIPNGGKYYAIAVFEIKLFLNIK